MAYGLNTSLADQIGPIISGLQQYGGIAQQGYGRQLQMTPELIGAGLRSFAQRRAETAKFLAEQAQRRKLMESDQLNDAVRMFGAALSGAQDRRQRKQLSDADIAQREKESRREADTRKAIAGMKDVDPEKMLSNRMASGVLEYLDKGKSDTLSQDSARGGFTPEEAVHKLFMGGSASEIPDDSADATVIEQIDALSTAALEVRKSDKFTDRKKTAQIESIKNQMVEVAGPYWPVLSNKTRKYVLNLGGRYGLMAEHYIAASQRKNQLAPQSQPPPSPSSAGGGVSMADIVEAVTGIAPIAERGRPRAERDPFTMSRLISTITGRPPIESSGRNVFDRSPTSQPSGGFAPQNTQLPNPNDPQSIIDYINQTLSPYPTGRY